MVPSFLQGVFLQSLRNFGKKAPRTLNPSHKILENSCKKQHFSNMNKIEKKFFILLFFIFENIRCHTCGKMKRKYFLYFEFFIRCLLIVAHFEKLREKGTSPSQKSDENFKFSPRCQVSENFLFHTLKLYIMAVFDTKK